MTDRQKVCHSQEYTVWRLAVLSRDGGKCRWCDSEGVKTYRPLEVHHIIPVSMASSGIFDVSNGIVLCKPHHQLTKGVEEVYAARLAAMIQQPLITKPSSSNPTKKPLVISAQELIALYWDQGLSCPQIGKQFNVTGACVLKHMKKYQIERRAIGVRPWH
jgi:hypothetical protein